MLDYEILFRKPNITLKSNVEGSKTVTCKDLLSGVFKAQDNISLRPVIVNKRYVGRPDLVSLAIYGTDRYGDIICKLNGISNPFELNDGDVLLVPAHDEIHYYLTNAGVSELAPNTDSLTMSQKETKQKQKWEIRSSNEQLVGSSNYYLDKSANIIFY